MEQGPKNQLMISARGKIRYIITIEIEKRTREKEKGVEKNNGKRREQKIVDLRYNRD